MTARNTEKRTCDTKPEYKQQKQRRSTSAKKQFKPGFELEINGEWIEVCNTAEDRLVLPEQLVLETEQPKSQVHMKLLCISKDIEKALEVYLNIVQPSFISAKSFSKRTFSFLSPTAEICLQQKRSL